MPELFFVNKKPLEAVNNVCQSMVFRCSPLKVIGQFRLNGIDCKTRVKFVIRHLVDFDPSVASQIGPLEFCLSLSFAAWISSL